MLYMRVIDRIVGGQPGSTKGTEREGVLDGWVMLPVVAVASTTAAVLAVVGTSAISTVGYALGCTVPMPGTRTGRVGLGVKCRAGSEV